VWLLSASRAKACVQIETHGCSSLQQLAAVRHLERLHWLARANTAQRAYPLAAGEADEALAPTLELDLTDVVENGPVRVKGQRLQDDSSADPGLAAGLARVEKANKKEVRGLGRPAWLNLYLRVRATPACLWLAMVLTGH
jgi:hypothetical protein